MPKSHGMRVPDHVLAAAMHADLERRVREISRPGSGAFGRLGAVEWVVVVIAFIVVPLGLWWWFG